MEEYILIIKEYQKTIFFDKHATVDDQTGVYKSSIQSKSARFFARISALATVCIFLVVE